MIHRARRRRLARARHRREDIAVVADWQAEDVKFKTVKFN